MDTLPSKEIMCKNGIYNKISKIYRPQDTGVTFKTVDEAKNYFWPGEAQHLFRYCCKEEYRLTDDSNGLHWTVGFGEPDNQTPGQIKWGDQWRDGKKELHDTNKWWKNIAVIEHNAPELF
jgi:hypothetical protein